MKTSRLEHAATLLGNGTLDSPLNLNSLPVGTKVYIERPREIDLKLTEGEAICLQALLSMVNIDQKTGGQTLYSVLGKLQRHSIPDHPDFDLNKAKEGYGILGKDTRQDMIVFTGSRL